MKEKKNYDNILKQHTALTSFKVKQGKYFNLQCEKIIFHLLKSKQNEMYLNFYSILEKELNNIFSNKKLGKEVIEQIYKKNFTSDTLDLSKIEVNKFALENLYRKIEEFNDLTENTHKKLSVKQREYCNLQVLAIKPTFSNQNLLTYKLSENTYLSPKELFSIIKDVKTYARQNTILKFALPESLDLTTLGNQVGITNMTNLKKYLKEAQETRLQFNLINNKNIEIEIDAPYITGITYISHKGKGTIFSYQIPVAILSLNLLPEIYAPLNELEVQKMTGKYTYRIYSLLKDHVNKGYLELTKEQLKDCLDLTERTITNSSTLKRNVLDPAIIELNEISNLECTYELIPPKRYKSVLFRMKTNNSKVIEVLKIVKDEEEKLDYKNDDEILERVEEIKHNIYISRAWDKRVDNKINKMLNELGKTFVLDILKELYKSLNSEIKITLVAYINGMLKNKKLANKSKTRTKINDIMSKNSKNIRNIIKEKRDILSKEVIEDAIIIEKNNEPILENTNQDKFDLKSALEYYYSLSKEEQEKLEEAFLTECSNKKSIPKTLLLELKKTSKEFYNDTISEFLLKTLNSKNEEEINEANIIKYINSLEEYEKLKIEEKAIELIHNEIGIDIEFLLNMKTKTRELYDSTLKHYYLKALRIF